MAKHLRMKCPNCHHWNRVPVNKIFIEQNSPEPKVKTYIPMYKPLEVTKCEKCGKVIAEPKEFIKVVKQRLDFLIQQNLVEEQNLSKDKIFYAITERGLKVLYVVVPIIEEARKIPASLY